MFRVCFLLCLDPPFYIWQTMLDLQSTQFLMYSLEGQLVILLVQSFVDSLSNTIKSTSHYLQLVSFYTSFCWNMSFWTWWNFFTLYLQKLRLGKSGQIKKFSNTKYWAMITILIFSWAYLLRISLTAKNRSSGTNLWNLVVPNKLNWTLILLFYKYFVEKWNLKTTTFKSFSTNSNNLFN